MDKNINKIKQIIYAIPIALSTIFLPGCEPEVENFPPKAEIEINPTKGEIPLEVRIKLSGSDLNGIEDIKNYRLNIDKEIINSKTPIDITRTFQNEGIVNVSGEVIDSKNLNDKTNINLIEIYGHSFLETSISLINNINIKYTTILSRVDKATLIINKEEKLFLTQEIKDVNQSGLDYDKTFNYSNDGIIKGLYEFILKSENLEKKDTIRILNYMPTMGTIAEVNFKEEEKVKIKLPGRSDKNPEDNPVPLKSAISLDGKTQPTIHVDSLEIKGLPNKNGAYQIEIEFGSVTGGLEKTVMGGYIAPDMRIEINPFVQPNDSTLNWYGSGDVNNDNIIDEKDLTKLNELIAGTYSNPNDKRLNDRADVNGDGIVSAEDKQILQNKLNNSILYMPGEWNKLKTRKEREDWLRKMLAIDKTNNMILYPGGNCVQYSNQTMINFRGFGNQKDISDFTKIYPYDFSNNGRFNLPLCEVIIAYYDSEGKVTGGHAMNTIVLGDYALNWNDLCNVEPQRDDINVQPGEDYLYGTNSAFEIRGPPITLGSGIIDMQRYFDYTIKNNIPTLFSLENTNLKIIYRR